MREIEILAKSEAEARTIAGEKTGIADEFLELTEEYEPDEQDLKDYAEKNNLEVEPSPDDLTLYVYTVAFAWYMKTAEEWTQGMIERFAPDSTATAIRLKNTIIVRLNVPESSILIGRKGATLDSLQHVVIRVLLTKDEKFPDVMLDVERYREKKLLRLEREAMRAADKALRSGRRQPLAPMSPAERKFIHKILKDVEGVRTESRGEDFKRHIVVESIAGPTGPRPAGNRRPQGQGPGGPRQGQSQGQGGNRAGGQGGPRKGNAAGGITEEQRQLLYGSKMSDIDPDEETNFDDLLQESRPSLLAAFGVSDDDDEGEFEGDDFADLEDDDDEDDVNGNR